MNHYITDSKLEPTLKAWIVRNLTTGRILSLAYEPLFNKNKQSRVPQILHCSHDQLAKLGEVYAQEIADHIDTHKKPNHQHENAQQWHHYALKHQDRQINAISYVMGEYATDVVKTISLDLKSYYETCYKNSVTPWEVAA